MTARRSTDTTFNLHSVLAYINKGETAILENDSVYLQDKNWLQKLVTIAGNKNHTAE